MARPALTPQAAQRAAIVHAQESANAAATLASILSGSWAGPDDKRQDTVLRCAKVLEAAGCYVRRQRELLAP